ncbi:PIN domain-containing protein [Microbacterium enclense]|uniref:PIN domain-containing protein n=1 Tax=Microbacterium enclense TaxID=993073 RepID=UPI003D736289
MKTLVLDTTELRRDWTFRGATAQLLGYAQQNIFLKVCVPPSCFEELIAHHERATVEAAREVERVHRTLQRLGLPSFEIPSSSLDYREFLLERFTETLGFEILAWPQTPHQQLVERASRRRPPFDSTGGGYRDSLVWESILELVRRGEDVVFATADKIFSGADGDLAFELVEEIAPLAGNVTLVRELPSWLRSNLPWRSSTVNESLALAQDEHFARYYTESDIHEALIPDASDLGFDLAPYSLTIFDVDWTGSLERTAAKVGSDGVVLVDYELGMIVEFEGEFPGSLRTHPAWDRTVVGYDRAAVTGTIDMVARIGVLFDDDLGMSFEQVHWRRADGNPAGQGIRPAFLGTPLFEME